MNVRILKINEVVFEGTANSVSAPATTGVMQILDNHKPIVATLRSGEVTVEGETKQSFPIEHGYLEATGEQVTILL